MKKFILFLLLMLVPTMSFAQWDRSGVRLATDCSSILGKGKLCYDMDDLKLYVGNGTAAVEVGAAISTGTSTPATCTEGALFWETDANVLWVCTATNTWGSIPNILGPPTVQSVTCTDSGDGNAGTLTITPTSGLARVDISLTVNDSDGCTITMSETGATDGTQVFITNISAANTATFTTSAGVLTLKWGSPYAMAAKETLILQYKSSEWLEIGRHSTTLVLSNLNMASATSSIPWKVGTDAASNTTEGTAYWKSDSDALYIGDAATSIGLDFTAGQTYTFPTTTATLARTDAGQTFTGVNAFTAPTITTSIAPASADGATLGTASYEFSDLYLADGGVIYLGNDQDVTLTHVADAGVTLNSTMKFHVGDTGTYINQPADGVMQVASDTEIRLLIGSEDLKLTSSANTVNIASNTSVDTITYTGITTITMPTANDPYIAFQETDGTDWWAGINDSANSFEFRSSATAGSGIFFQLLEGGNEMLLSTTTVSFAADGDTTLYTVPTGKRCVLTKAIIVAAADAGSTDITIGQDGAESDWLPTNQMDNLDAQYDAIIVMPVPNTTPAKIKSYAATTVIQINVANHAGAAGNTVYLFGILY